MFKFNGRAASCLRNSRWWRAVFFGIFKEKFIENTNTYGPISKMLFVIIVRN
jgi:hypothetical protein